MDPGNGPRDDMDVSCSRAWLQATLTHKRKLPDVVDGIVAKLEHTGTIDHVCHIPLPDEEAVIRILDLLSEALFPGYFGKKVLDKPNLKYHLGETVNTAYNLLAVEIAKCRLHACPHPGDASCRECEDRGIQDGLAVLERIPALIEVLDGDVRALYRGDPAAKSHDEIILCYPGFRAILTHRIAHELHSLQVPLLPRIMAEYAHRVTGIDIHPGAAIGSNFFIDHGTGVVIGETTVIGDNVKLYQGVTLGALSFPTDEHGRVQRDFKRHPNIEDDVVIYSNSTILGNVTIGRGSVIGGNVFLTHSVPPGSKVVIERPTHEVKEQS